MTKHFNWGILGLGTVANEWATAFTNTNEHTLYAAASRNLDKATTFCQKYKIPNAYNYEQLLADKNVDIIYIATPHNLHYNQIKQALNAGKHVFCEKAITTNLVELEDLIQLAQQKNLILLEGTTLFYMPIAHKVKNLIQSGNYGPLKMMQVNFGSYKPYDENNRFFNPNLAGGALLDIGVYAIAACVFFLNAKPKLKATTVVKAATGVDESSIIMLENDKQELASINLTFRAKMPKRCLIALEEGYFEILNYPRAEEATFTTHEGQQTIIREGETKLAFSYEQAIMEQLIATKQSNNEYLELTHQVMQIMDACQKEWD